MFRYLRTTTLSLHTILQVRIYQYKYSKSWNSINVIIPRIVLITMGQFHRPRLQYIAAFKCYFSSSDRFHDARVILDIVENVARQADHFLFEKIVLSTTCLKELDCRSSKFSNSDLCMAGYLDADLEYIHR